MPWWDKLALGKYGLSKKDLEMMEHVPHPDDIEYMLTVEEESKNIYNLPLALAADSLDLGNTIAQKTPGVPPERLRQVGGFLVEDSVESHKLQFRQALDFLVPDGTTVFAAADGIVTEIIEENDKWGPTEQFADFQNRITIKHSNGEYSQYIHLEKGSVSQLIDLNQPSKQNIVDGFGNKINRIDVSAGEPIARVGKTGWTDRDHLHFMVFRMLSSAEMHERNNQPPNWKSLKPRFIEDEISANTEL